MRKMLSLLYSFCGHSVYIATIIIIFGLDSSLHAVTKIVAKTYLGEGVCRSTRSGSAWRLTVRVYRGLGSWWSVRVCGRLARSARSRRVERFPWRTTRVSGLCSSEEGILRWARPWGTRSLCVWITLQQIQQQFLTAAMVKQQFPPI